MWGMCGVCNPKDTSSACNFQAGYPVGGSLKRIGNTDTREECAARVRMNEPSASGATYPTLGSKGCDANFGVTDITTNPPILGQIYQTCLFATNLEKGYGETCGLPNGP